MTLTQRKRSTNATQTGITASPVASGQARSSIPVNSTAASGDRAAEFSAAEREKLIAIAAYYRAEHRSFSEGSLEQDWLEVEAEIDAVLGRQSS